MKKFKVQNIPIANSNEAPVPAASQPSTMKMNPNAFEFKPSFAPTTASAPAFTPPKAPEDKVASKLTALGSSSDDIVAFKNLMNDFKEDKIKRKENEPINLDLFIKLGSLKVCQTKDSVAESLDHVLNKHLIIRVECETQKGKGGNKNNNYQRGKTQHNKGGDGNDFNKGSKQHYNRNNTFHDMGSWKQEDTAEKAKLKEKAIA